MIAKYTLYVRKRSQQMAGVNLTSVKLMAQSFSLAEDRIGFN